MSTVTIEIPDEVVASFENLEEVRKTVYEDFIVEQRQRGNISLGRAAELLGLTYTEFFELLGKRGLSFVNAAPQEMEESYQRLYRLLEQRKS